mmetsp:Transcript_10656/g.39776  ORF Transcript_10656/g.39776 Transcript_10656/m.39776 type:complete len:524 (+) Transcript_10656:384-1955(+)
MDLPPSEEQFQTIGVELEHGSLGLDQIQISATDEDPQSTISPMESEHNISIRTSTSPRKLKNKRSSNLSVSQPVKMPRNHKKRLFQRVLGCMLCSRYSRTSKTPKTPKCGPRTTLYFDESPFMSRFVPGIEPGVATSLNSTLITARKAAAKGRNHMGKIEFFHELPIDIVLHITDFLELELTHRRHLAAQSGTTSPVFKQMFGVVRPWNIYRVIFPNVCLDMTVYNKRQDLRCLIRHGRRLRIIGGCVKAGIVRDLLLKSQLESISIMLSEKGAKGLFTFGDVPQSTEPISPQQISPHASMSHHLYPDDISDVSSASHTGSSASRLAFRSKELKRWSMDGSSAFRKNTSEESIHLFSNVMRLHAALFANLTSFSAEKCPNLNGKQISLIISTLGELKCPLKHFTVSPSNAEDVSISIYDYLGIENWELHSLHFVVTEVSHTAPMGIATSPAVDEAWSATLPSPSRESAQKKHVDAKDVSALLFPMRNSLRELHCNLDSASISFIFDSATYPKLTTVSLEEFSH